jgi:integrase
MPPKIGALIDEYEQGAKLRGIAPTQMNALKVVRRAFGGMYPDRLRPQTFTRYVAERRQGLHSNCHGTRPAKDGTIRRELGALSAVLNWAHSKRLIKEAPPSIDLPPPSPARKMVLTAEQATGLWEQASGEALGGGGAGLFACLALDTWSRANAIETLPWGRVHEDYRWIDYNDPNRAETSKRRVLVPVSSRLRDVLIGCDAGQGDDWLVVGDVSHYEWSGFVERSGLPRFTRHDLRRTGISLALARGVEPLKVAQMAGDDLATIMKHYAHFMPDYLDGVVD